MITGCHYICRLTSDFSVVLSKYLGSTEPKTIRAKIVRLILIMMMAFCNWNCMLVKIWKRSHGHVCRRCRPWSFIMKITKSSETLLKFRPLTDVMWMQFIYHSLTKFMILEVNTFTFFWEWWCELVHIFRDLNGNGGIHFCSQNY